MDDLNLLEILFILAGCLMVLGMVITIIDVAKENSLPDYQKSRYTQNKIVKAMSIEEYNKTYNELSIPEKEHIIREYQINTYNRRDDNHAPVIMPAPVMPVPKTR